MQEGQLNKRLDDFLQSELIATIAVPINAAGDIHIASLVYWNDTSPLLFYFVSSRSSEKFGLLVNQPSVPAACVVGTYNKTPATLQMRGTLTKIDYTTVPGVVEHYHTKRGNTHDDIENPDNVLVCFTPHWARFTEYKPHTAITLLDVS